MRNFPAIFTKFLFQKNLKMLQSNAVEQTTVALARHIHVAFLKSSRAQRTVSDIWRNDSKAEHKAVKYPKPRQTSKMEPFDWIQNTSLKILQKHGKM